jgi:hypothetical protein
MDATITYDEVAALVGINILTLEPRSNFNIFGCYVGTSNVPSNVYRAHKASSMDGKVW